MTRLHIRQENICIYIYKAWWEQCCHTAGRFIHKLTVNYPMGSVDDSVMTSGCNTARCTRLQILSHYTTMSGWNEPEVSFHKMLHIVWSWPGVSDIDEPLELMRSIVKHKKWVIMKTTGLLERAPSSNRAPNCYWICVIWWSSHCCDYW